MSAARSGCRALCALRAYNTTATPRVQIPRRAVDRLSRQIVRTYSEASSTTQPPKPSFLRRAATFIATGIVFTTLGFAMAAAPALPALNGILTPPTDEETLTMFKPEDPKEIEVEEYINNHWVSAEMRKKPGFAELRPHMKIPAPFRANNLTAGVLLGPNKVVVPPIAWVEEGGKSIVSISYLGPELCGHPGIVHGGFLATMLDEGMARCCFGALPHNIGMTANLNINYRAPAKASSYVVLRAETTKVEGRKAEVVGRIETLPEKEGDAPLVLAEATALFVSPKQAAMMKNVYPVQ
ncbi:uncharacterized protein JN550_006273 [Neoarthrinium moseri]|uniref:uncharacterized protein n=1 Tax=Neoarthrinium moseri TaxID=1658444 RepID=UPI001FDBBDBE|nr:uncharacterized protein JN550_006273 [Neoarthrinium moseri]KAI1868698.1 hypothetical protein JN550_006273 [Neoarthrinium moseri]